MLTAFEYLKTNPVFHLATVEGNKPRVRPFSFCMKRNGRLYFCTTNTKEIYKQLVQNPEIEISDLAQDGSWLRIRGRIAFDESKEAKEQAFKEAPQLLSIYPKGADEPTFITFYFMKAEAMIFSFMESPKKVSLL